MLLIYHNRLTGHRQAKPAAENFSLSHLLELCGIGSIQSKNLPEHGARISLKLSKCHRGMNFDDIRKMDELYICRQCSAAFLFKDDVENHKQESGHTEITYTSLEGWR